MVTSNQVAVRPQGGMPDIPGYDVMCELGRGGMGVVYKARQIRLDRLVALKMILGARVAHFLQLARFRVEAEAIACLAHPNIVRIHEVGVHQGSPYVAIEFAPGGSLAQKIRNQPQPPRWAAGLACVLASALHHAHKRGILHRDLKPANILLMGDDSPKITDFGLAKFSRAIGDTEDVAGTICMDPLTAEMHRLAREFAREAQSEIASEATVEQLVVQSLCHEQLGQFGPEVSSRSVRAVEEFLEESRRQLAHPTGSGPGVGTSLISSLYWLDGLTEDGTVMGTPQYMAPEQAMGQIREIGPHTDVYSLGAVLYELLTGQPPFSGATREQIRQRVICQPPPPIRPTVPRDLVAICLKCLEKQPEQRYGSAVELRDELQRFLDNNAAGDEPDRPALGDAPRELSTLDYNQSSRQRTKSWWQFWK